MTGALRIVPNPADLLDGYQRLANEIGAEFRVPVLHVPAEDRVLGGTCIIPECAEQAVSAKGCCLTHYKRGRRAGLEKAPDRNAFWEAFIADPALHGGPASTTTEYRFDDVPEILGNELRLYVQFLRATGKSRHLRAHFNWIKRRAVAAGVKSIFDDTPTTPQAIVMNDVLPVVPSWALKVSDPAKGGLLRGSGGPRPHGMIRDIMRLAAFPYANIPVETRDAWHPRWFGYADEPERPDSSSIINFTPFQHQWYKDWVKRFARHRMKTRDVTWGTLANHVTRLLHFDKFMTARGIKLRDMRDLDREQHLEEYLLWVRNESGLSPNSFPGVVSGIRVLLDTHQQLGWTPLLKRSAIIRDGEVPGRLDQVPHPIEAFVLAQIMDDKFLSQCDRVTRNAIIISRHHGLRMGSLVTLKFDPITYPVNSPVLSYHNQKLNRPAQQPIMKQIVLEAIKDQQAWVQERYPNGCEWLFPADRDNPFGTQRMSTGTLPRRFKTVLATTDVRDRGGRAVTTLAWGQFRDTVATEWLNRQPNPVPPAVVAALLDHRNTKSLDHYCRMQAETMAAELDKEPRVNRHGEEARPKPDALPDRDVEFWRDSLRLATSVVPGGYCGLPEHEKCPHHNRCYTCDDFVTSPKRLPEHLAYLEEAQMFAMAHEQQGKKRMVEADQEVVEEVKAVIRPLLSWVDTHPEDVFGTSLEDWLLANKPQLDALRIKDEA